MRYKKTMMSSKKGIITIPLYLWIAILLTSCAHVISKEVLKEVDRDISFAALLRDPDAYLGKTVLVGGKIIEVKNLSGKTLLFVLQHPLDRRGKPLAVDTSEGRFIVAAPGLLDPAIYAPGRLITCAGRVAGKEARPLGEISYTYPVIEQRELYLLPLESTTSEPRFHIGVGVGVGF